MCLRANCLGEKNCESFSWLMGWCWTIDARIPQRAIVTSMHYVRFYYEIYIMKVSELNKRKGEVEVGRNIQK